ncbi:MAG TPA: hypothetical protein VHM64_22780 [Candidatus Binatia bacterium]|nr:hypothetical protein [Candidatus Binatia bacterium]
MWFDYLLDVSSEGERGKIDLIAERLNGAFTPAGLIKVAQFSLT